MSSRPRPNPPCDGCRNPYELPSAGGRTASRYLRGVRAEEGRDGGDALLRVVVVGVARCRGTRVTRAGEVWALTARSRRGTIDDRVGVARTHLNFGFGRPSDDAAALSSGPPGVWRGGVPERLGGWRGGVPERLGG